MNQDGSAGSSSPVAGPADTALPDGGEGWLAAARVLCTDRFGGHSKAPFATNNLALHVEDNSENVLQNRMQLTDKYKLKRIQWLDQIHGVRVIEVTADAPSKDHNEPSADAMFTMHPRIGLGILTADCLPVMLTDTRGTLVAAAHAGWRGLCAGILNKLVEALPVTASQLQAFIGPAIGKQAFEVGPEVVEALDNQGLNRTLGGQAVTSRRIDTQGDVMVDKYQVDLALAARINLIRLGVGKISGGHWCTFTDPRLYSWRRETREAAVTGEKPLTGRQASVIWLP